MPGLTLPYVKQLSQNTSLEGPSLRFESPKTTVIGLKAGKWARAGWIFYFFFCLYQIENWCSLTFVRLHLEGKITTYWLSLIQVTGTTVRHFFKLLFMWLSLCDRSRSSYRPSSRVSSLQNSLLATKYFIVQLLCKRSQWYCFIMPW